MSKEPVSFELDNILKKLPDVPSLSGNQPRLPKTAYKQKYITDNSEQSTSYMAGPNENYIEVAKKDWRSLEPKKTFIRYYDKKGEWRAGGRIQEYFTEGIKIGKMANGQWRSWIIKFDNIAKLYKYIAKDPEPMEKQPVQTTDDLTKIIGGTLTQEEKMMNDLGGKILFGPSVEDLTKRIEVLERECSNYKSEIKKITDITKNIWNILLKAEIIKH